MRKRKLETSKEEPEPEPRYRTWRSRGYALGFDLDWSSYQIIESTWKDYDDIALFARIGLHCHNLQNGTNYKFNRLEKYGMSVTSYMDYYITFEVTDPASGSVFSFQTMLSDAGLNPPLGIRVELVSLAARVKAKHGLEIVDEDWVRDSAVADIYKGPMPKWFTDEALADKNFYEVQESELHENDWLQLLTEVAFYSNTDRGANDCNLLEINKFVVEEYTTEAHEKLKADNAIFYISYKCNAYPWAGDYNAIIRKTMDGKPGHMSLEVAFTEEQRVERGT